MTSPPTLVKTAAETVLFDFDCSALLGASETIAAVSSITADANDGAALSFGAPAINSSAVAYTTPYRRTVGSSRVIQVLIGGGSAAGSSSREYTVRARFTTTNAGELREAVATLIVLP
jgi:hypothetical protein